MVGQALHSTVLLPGIQRCSADPVAVDQAAVLVCGSARDGKHSLLPGTVGVKTSLQKGQGEHPAVEKWLLQDQLTLDLEELWPLMAAG